ncbi:6119_t:CDS:10 [Acaulospora morrowiae]|uniref:6119_t:CDS:1 n=1 Tax=Acaulospora morrowiae TaxID=94023 RepID=A0A9N9AXU2_9GLOM|nr:6119_t:CDS:10 [Acaulospora morrowiae]
MPDEISSSLDTEETPQCMGCGLPIEEGIAFGEGIWHVQCFRCAKCRNLVEHDSNLFLLSDGNPICEKCTYNCCVCKKPILDEAIMTGEESFHVECFRCRQCRSKIEDLVFAKTNQASIFTDICSFHPKKTLARRAKEREQASHQTPILEKSLPSLPAEAGLRPNMLENPNNFVHPKRSFERNATVPLPSDIPSEVTDNVPKAHTLPVSSNSGINRRHSRLFDPSVVDMFKQKPTSPTSKSPEQLIKSNNTTLERFDSLGDKGKARVEPLESPKKTSLFSRRNESSDSLSKMTPRNREIIENHSRNASITSSRSEPYDGSGRTFSLTSQRSDISDLWSRKLPTSSTHERGEADNTNRKPGSLSRKLKPSAIQQNQQSLPHIEEYSINFQVTPPLPSENPSLLHTRSNSPATPRSNSPISPRFPSSPGHKDHHGNGVSNVGPPVLPPLSFFNEEDDDDLISLMSDGKSETNDQQKKRQTLVGELPSDDSSKLQSGSVTPDFIENSSNSSLSPDRKNSQSSLASLSSRENETMELEDVPVEELRKMLIETRKKLTEAESNCRKIKRASQKTLDEFSLKKEEFNNQVSLRQKAEVTIEQLKVQIELQNQKLEAARLDREQIEQMIQDSRTSKQQLQELQNSLKEMNLQKEMMISEIELLVRERQAGLAGNITPNVSKDLPGSLAKHLSSQFDEVKQNYLLEIRSLQEKRDTLKQETEQLQRTRDQYVEEVENLNTKNLELTEVNNELTRQVESQNKGKSANGFNFFKSNRHSPGHNHTPSDASGANQKGHVKQPSLHTIDSDVPDGAPIVSLTNVAHRNSIGRGATPKKFKWRKGGKVLNKILVNANAVTDGILGSLGAGTDAHKKMNQQLNPSRAHNWQSFSFLRPVNCENCHEKIWSEVKCTGCNITVHAKCSSMISPTCVSSRVSFETDSDTVVNENNVSIFGNDLVKQSELEGDEIPLVMRKCITAVEVRGMDLEGIYRKSGGASQMRGIVTAFENGDEIDLDDPDQFNDICAVTSVLKQYLRELPNPLLTYELYPNFLESIGLENEEEKLEKFRQLLLCLPKAHYDAIKYLMLHLDRVKQQEAENLMSAKNLSVVFGPTLLRGPNPNTEILDMTYKNATIEFIIENVHELFSDTSDRRKDGFI